MILVCFLVFPKSCSIFPSFRCGFCGSEGLATLVTAPEVRRQRSEQSLPVSSARLLAAECGKSGP